MKKIMIPLPETICFDNVVAIQEQVLSAYVVDKENCVDFGGVKKNDSSALALMMACMRAAKVRSCRLTFMNISSQLQDLMRVCGVDIVLWGN